MEIAKFLNIFLHCISFFKSLKEIDDNNGLQRDDYKYMGLEFNSQYGHLTLGSWIGCGRLNKVGFSAIFPTQHYDFLDFL